MYLYGASGHAKVIVDIVEAMGDKVLGLIDDNEHINCLLDIPVVHHYTGQNPLIISIGVNATRKKIVEKLVDARYGLAIHPFTCISPRASIAEGTVVMQGALIQTDAKIGRHCIVNTGAIIDHECQLGDYVHVSPHATLCGNVTVGEGAWVGAGTVVKQGVHIGAWSVVGAGSVVIDDIPDKVVAFGNKAIVMRNI